jgi:hypothetical protein
MRKFLVVLAGLLLAFNLVNAQPAAIKVEQWDKYEIVLKGPVNGNPFIDVSLSAQFKNGTTTIVADGFYDGDGIYRIRFMPQQTGHWSYITKSNVKTLAGKTGGFDCVKAMGSNHGPVKVWDTYNFQYSDGKVYYPFGTTSYAWIHQGAVLQQETLNTLAAAPFNKLRMCVFPKYYTYVEKEPELYPFEKDPNSKPVGKAIAAWDFKKFNPAFFRHLEDRVTDLMKLGIEADLIIFHPYDKGHWGFDAMGKEVDLRYIRYLVARMGAYRNVWWSMANEFDYIKAKPREVWDTYSQAVVDADPYHHLVSIHNGSVYYDNWKPQFTHVSIQNGAPVEDFGRAMLLRDVYRKPIVYDEVCYEGNLEQRWGRLTGEEMTHAVWQGIIAGTYVTHGETYKTGGDTIFWAHGGKLKGTSPARIGFLRKIMEDGPGPLTLADEWKDNQTAQSGTGYYLIYFGKNKQTEWMFNLPKKNIPAKGTKFRVDLIDTWNMTITPVNEVFTIGDAVGYRVYDTQQKKITMPDKPYLALRITQIK